MPFFNQHSFSLVGDCGAWDEIQKLFEPVETETKWTLEFLSNDKPKLGKETFFMPEIRHLQFNEEARTTAIVWDDGTVTTVICAEDAPFEPYVGFCAAVCKKLYGSTTAVKKLIEEKDVDAARKAKAKAREERIQAQLELERRNHERAVRRAAKQKLFEAEVDAMVEQMRKDKAHEKE